MERDGGDNVSSGRQVTMSGHQTPVVTSAPVVSPPSHTADNPQPMSTFTEEIPPEPGSGSKQETATQSPPKRVSKFRALRMQQEAKR